VAPVVWIGGAPGAGKSTVARTLARRYGLRLYAADTRTWVHRDRALAAGIAAARRFEELTPAERWQRPAAELVDMALHRERGPMVLADLAALPDAPLVVAEGTTLPAHAADPARSVWLLPTPEFQAARLAARATSAGQTRLFTALTEIVAAEAREHGLPTLTVDGSTGVADTTRAVEALLAGPLRDGPHATDEAQRRQLLREQNRAGIEQVRGFYARPWATGDPDAVEVEFACECGDPACDRTVRRRIGDYRTPCRAD
jgi:AAA domain